MQVLNSEYVIFSLTNPSSLVTKPQSVIHKTERPSDLIPRSLKKLPHRPALSHPDDHVVLPRRPLTKRKESYESDNSSESSGESFFKVLEIIFHSIIYTCTFEKIILQNYLENCKAYNIVQNRILNHEMCKKEC